MRNRSITSLTCMEKGKRKREENESFTGLAFEGCYFSDESQRLPIDQPVPQWWWSTKPHLTPTLLSPQPSRWGPHTNHIPAITPVAFPGLQKLILTSCILKKKQAFLISYWNTDATAQCLNGNVIRYMNKLHEPVREGRKKLKKQIYQWTNVNGQDSWFTGSKQGSNWICTASAKAAAYWTICFLITLRCSFCWILVKMPCWIRATLCLVLPQPSPVVG